jgi:hypothetical protein
MQLNVRAMHPRPIYRWTSFWLGVLILLLLGWAWARSMAWSSEASQ